MVKGQNNTPQDNIADSAQKAAEKYLLQQKEQQRLDSITTLQLEQELEQGATGGRRKIELQDSLKSMSAKDSVARAERLMRIDELKKTAKAYPVYLLTDTLFYINTRIGSFSAAERSEAISARIKKLYDDAFFNADTLKVIGNENTYDIVYNNDYIIMSITDVDGLWHNMPPQELANEYLERIKTGILKVRKENNLFSWLKRIGYICLIIIGIWIIIYGINRLFKRSAAFLALNKRKYFTGFKIRNVQIFSEAQHYLFALRVNSFLRIIIIILAIYLALPLLFSIFPQTKFFADMLLTWITTPAKAIFNGIINFLPDLFTIIVIYIATKYFVRFIKYFATEIGNGNIQMKGFYADWAAPTFNVIRILIYAFMFILIFPYLPGSGSPAFQGVSVFLGVLFSLGSTSAISNMVAGMVITYMRPFRRGDRVKIGDVVGDVIEKTMLVTRIRTIKNEDITVPNSTVLNTHTINYSTNAPDTGLIIHTTVTIGYDVPWKKMHEALLEAAARTTLIVKDPSPFVLQTSLDDFYVSYQVNGFIRESNKQAFIYSELHQHIQDVCNERGIEILSPHYRAARDGNMSTIPADYLPKDYKAQGFNFNVKKNE